MGDNNSVTGQKSGMSTGPKGFEGDDGQHRQGSGGGSGDQTGIRSIPRSHQVGEERGHDVAEKTPTCGPINSGDNTRHGQ